LQTVRHGLETDAVAVQTILNTLPHLLVKMFVMRHDVSPGPFLRTNTRTILLSPTSWPGDVWKRDDLFTGSQAT
jgi:hypothetical protein